MNSDKRDRCKWCGRLRCRADHPDPRVSSFEDGCEPAHAAYFDRLKRAVREADCFFGDDDSWQHGDGRPVNLKAIRMCKEAIQ